MRTRMAASTAAIAALACAGPFRAHHSISMFDTSTPIWVNGTVVRYSPINPHGMIALEVRAKDGHQQLWTVEGPEPAAQSSTSARFAIAI